MNDCDTLPKMAATVVTPPAVAILSRDEVYQQLRLTGQFGASPDTRPDDTLLDAIALAATQELDGPEGWLGRALITQTIELALPAFPAGPIVLPWAPLQSVTSVKYLDTDGVDTTLVDGTDYRVGVEDPRAPYITPAYGKAFPSVRRQGGSVRVRYVAGYGDTSAAVPELIKQYARFRVGFYYENREHIVTGTISTELPTVASMLNGFRIQGTFRP